MKLNRIISLLLLYILYILPSNCYDLNIKPSDILGMFELLPILKKHGALPNIINAYQKHGNNINAMNIMEISKALLIDDKHINSKQYHDLFTSIAKFTEDRFDIIVGNKTQSNCVACTIVMSLVTQKLLILAHDIDNDLSNVCAEVKNSTLQNACAVVKAIYGVLLSTVEKDSQPDQLCGKLKMCPTPPTCVLFPQWPPQQLYSKNKYTHPQRYIPEDPTVGNFLDDFEQLLKFLAGGISGGIENIKKHIPLHEDDWDYDLFSNSSTFRGYSWRGRDCNVSDNSIYPGRSMSSYSSAIDHNCNGIYGNDPTSGESYEDKFCKDSGRMGVVILGDSAAAHFSLPPQLFSASELDMNVIMGLVHDLENEIDWPECSWSTGYENNTLCPSTPSVPIRSIYSYLASRNLCNHRDYQNIGVNGARVGSMADSIIQSFRRDQKNDAPALVFFALIGNDVCNGHPGMSHMTNVSDFEQEVLKSLDYLDTTLPEGSHVIFMPLADGELLYSTLHNRTHPIGTTYEAFYDYLACQSLTPCWGWMNSNATWRNKTQIRANQLSAVYPKIIQKYSYKHFNMHMIPDGYYYNVMNKWVAQGGDPADLIEPVDGFHPSQLGNSLIAEEIWSWLESINIVGKVNPYNSEIQKIFGNQGGY